MFSSYEVVVHYPQGCGEVALGCPGEFAEKPMVDVNLDLDPPSCVVQVTLELEMQPLY